MRSVLERAHLDRALGKSRKARGGKPDHSLGVGVYNVAGANRDSSYFHGLIRTTEAEGAVMDRYAARIRSHRDGEEAVDVANAAVRNDADAADRRERLGHSVADRAFVIRPRAHALDDPDTRKI